MGAPVPWDPCLTPLERRPTQGRGRIRVVEILATGTNGGAQEHLFGLMSRLDLLRGDEPYKYEWGAVDEPIQRILVRRRNSE